MSAPHDETHEMHSEVATIARAMLSAGLAVADARRGGRRPVLADAAGPDRRTQPGGTAHDADHPADLGAFPGHRRKNADPRGHPRPVGEHPPLPERGSPHPPPGPGLRPLTPG
jgi:hypothetical protein